MKCQELGSSHMTNCQKQQQSVDVIRPPDDNNDVTQEKLKMIRALDDYATTVNGASILLDFTKDNLSDLKHWIGMSEKDSDIFRTTKMFIQLQTSSPQNVIDPFTKYGWIYNSS